MHRSEAREFRLWCRNAIPFINPGTIESTSLVRKFLTALNMGRAPVFIPEYRGRRQQKLLGDSQPFRRSGAGAEDAHLDAGALQDLRIHVRDGEALDVRGMDRGLHPWALVAEPLSREADDVASPIWISEMRVRSV